MKIAFVHYHLKAGGVTTCLKQQVKALKDDCNVCILTGELPQNSFPARLIHIPELAYSIDYHKPFTPEDVAAAVVKAIQLQFNGPCDIVHVHNPILAKNKNFLKILNALLKRDICLLLQIHDFAEDGRPLSYFQEGYPVNCHYAVVNSRDYAILRKSGLKKQGLHQISNTVDLPDEQPDPSDAGPYVVYPIRAIRRKNIGEAILLSLFFDNQETLVITLPPNSPADMESYRDWKAFVADEHLRVEFDRGLTHAFEAIVRSARYLLTTSITEGFGFSFIEPWVFGKSVWGRKLSEICTDFEANGVNLDHMYTRLNVPVDWIESDVFFKSWDRTIRSIGKLFGLKIGPERIKSAYAAITADGTIDFGLLNEKSQKRVIRWLVADTSFRKKLLRLNPALSKIGEVANKKDLIKSNYKAVVDNYNMGQYRRRLLYTYEHVKHTSIRQRIDKKILLNQFLDLSGFSLLKWGDYDT